MIEQLFFRTFSIFFEYFLLLSKPILTQCLILFCKVIKGNSNEGAVQLKTFTTPFITQVVRVIPVAKNERPACMTMELYGCGKFVMFQQVLLKQIMVVFVLKVL